jgi:sugar/nucleoside kinase (ribokinase family)
MSAAPVAPELVVAGNLLVDDIVFHDGRTLMGEPGGGALYVSLAASLWGVRVGLVSLRGTDYPAHATDALRARGVDLEGVRALDGPALRTWLLYEARGRQILHQLGAPGHTTVSPEFRDFPARYLGCRVAHVCPIPFSQQRELVEDLARAKVAISLDPHEPVRADNLEAWGHVLERLELFFISHEELRLGDVERDPRSALLQLERVHPTQSFLLKRGALGGLLYDVPGARFESWEPRFTQVVDSTGAGDAFAGGVLAGWLKGEPWARTLQRGVVSASFAMEAWGPRALIAATHAAAERRLLDWYGDGLERAAGARASGAGGGS